MKRFLAVAAALAGLFVMPMAAQATTTTTFHLPAGAVIDVGPAGCIIGDLSISGNGVLHTTVNNAGDVWVTGTLVGSVTDADAGYSGHGVAWFGLEQNSMNSVNHFTANTQGTLKDGTPLSIHQEGQFTINAQGLPVVTRVTVTCR